MESVEVVCVEIKKNEKGEIVYVEKMENNNSESPEDFCVMECEIATTENTSSPTSREKTSPVEIIVFPNFSDKLSERVTNEKDIIVQKKIHKDNDYNMTLTGAELALHKDTQRLSAESKTNDDFDIVLKLAMRGESNVVSKLPVNRQCEEVNIVKKNHDVQVNKVEKQKNKLWTLLDKQDRCNTVSKTCGRLSTNSVGVRRTYSGIIPKKSYTSQNNVSQKESYNGCFPEHPFRCKICDQSFRQDSSLKIHLKVHAGKFSDNCIIN